jgi:hypothetical protein
MSVELRWNGATLRTHATRELAQLDLDDCLTRRVADVTRALGEGHPQHRAHVGEFSLADVAEPEPSPAPASPSIVVADAEPPEGQREG